MGGLATAILVLAWVGAVTTTAFPVLYGCVAPWYKSWLGRSIMAESIAFAIAMDLTIALHYVLIKPWHLWVVMGVYVLIAATTMGVSAVLVLLQWKGRYVLYPIKDVGKNVDGAKV